MQNMIYWYAGHIKELNQVVKFLDQRKKLSKGINISGFTNPYFLIF